MSARAHGVPRKARALQTALPVLERSDTEYVILSDTTVLCAIDFSKVVDAHVASGCDLTVVAKAGKADGKHTQTLAVKVDENGKVVDLAVDYCAPADYLTGMSMFVIERKKLLNIIHELVPHGKCYFERDFVLPQYNEGKLSVNVYSFQNIALFNESLQQYYTNNLSLLDQEVRHSLFQTRPSDLHEGPRLGADALRRAWTGFRLPVADGCHIFGKANHSVIFREVDLDEDTEVESSVLMQGSKVGARSKLRYVILDKNVTVKPDTKLQGTPEHPLYISKGVTV